MTSDPFDPRFLRVLKRSRGRARRRLLRSFGFIDVDELSHVVSYTEATAEGFAGLLRIRGGVVLVNVVVPKEPGVFEVFIDVLGGDRKELEKLVDQIRPGHVKITLVVRKAPWPARLGRFCRDALRWWKGDRTYFPWPGGQR